MDALDKLLPLLYDLDFGDEFILPLEILEADFDVWVAVVNISNRQLDKKESPMLSTTIRNDLASVDGNSLLVSLAKNGIVPIQFGEFGLMESSNPYSSNKVGVISAKAPSHKNLEVTKVPFADFAISCAYKRMGLGIIDDGNFVLATYKFMSRVFDGVQNELLQHAVDTLYSEGKSYTFKPAYEIAFRDLLLDEGALVESIDYGCVEFSAGFNVVFSVNLRENTGARPEEVERIMTLLNKFLEPMGNQAVIHCSVGEQIILSPHVKRIEIPRIDFDPSEFFGF